MKPVHVQRERTGGGADLWFGCRLRDLRLAALKDAPQQALLDQVAFITALEGHADATFCLQMTALPKEARDRGSLSVDVLCRLECPAGDAEARRSRFEELADDLMDLLWAQRRWYRFSPIVDTRELRAVLDPIAPTYVCEILRRKEPLETERKQRAAGFAQEGGGSSPPAPPLSTY